jgi:hypothetical protein
VRSRLKVLPALLLAAAWLPTAAAAAHPNLLLILTDNESPTLLGA